MFRKLLVVSTLVFGGVALAASVGGCSDDDFGQERPAADASATVTSDLGDAGAPDLLSDLAKASSPDLLSDLGKGD